MIFRFFSLFASFLPFTVVFPLSFALDLLRKMEHFENKPGTMAFLRRIRVFLKIRVLLEKHMGPTRTLGEPLWKTLPI